MHRLGQRAENKVEKELLQDFKRVSGKTGLLYQLAEITVANPEGIVQDVIYPVVGKQKLIDLVKEFKSRVDCLSSKGLYIHALFLQ